MKKIIIITTLLLCLTTLFGQNKYYKNQAGKIYNSNDYKTSLNKALKEMQAISSKYRVYEEIILSYKNKDSIVYDFKWHFTNENPKKLQKEIEGKNALIGKQFTFETTSTLEGKKISINDLKGKPTLINFWFTACSICVEEMPALNEMKEKYGNDFNFVAITFNKKAKVEKFLKDTKFNFTHITDARTIIKFFGFKGFPNNVFLDKKGVVRKIIGNIPLSFDNNGNKVWESKEVIDYLFKLQQE